MQGTQAQSLVQEDSPCQGATKPVHHNYWSLSALDSNAVDHTDESLSATTMSGPCSPATRELNKAHAQQKDPAWPKMNESFFKKEETDGIKTQPSHALVKAWNYIQEQKKNVTFAVPSFLQ